jgi:hypothetical protein
MLIKHPNKGTVREWIVKVMMNDPHLSVLVDLASSENRRRAWVESSTSPEAIEQIHTPWGPMTRWFAAHTIVKDWSKVWPRR